ncbi:MAG: 3-dehydroquinate dehydratase [Actinomycetota bacterium]|nr:3-dehydroquinate dehydratase [Actinomycetota bacterium]
MSPPDSEALTVTTPAATVFVLNGPNLNLLGTREPGVYGSSTLSDVETLCRDVATGLALEVDFRQSNHEGDLVDWIHEAGRGYDEGTVLGVVINPGAYTHTSIALHDAVAGVRVPVIECHISNVHAREAFRHHSFVSPVARAVVLGFGVAGYPLAIEGLHRLAASRADG